MDTAIQVGSKITAQTTKTLYSIGRALVVFVGIGIFVACAALVLAPVS